MKTTKEYNWENNYHVKELTEIAVNEIVEMVTTEYDNIDEDSFNDALWECVNGHAYVIYNYNARRLAEAHDLNPFDYSEYFGERYDSYGEMAFEVLYTRAYEKLVEYFVNLKQTQL